MAPAARCGRDTPGAAFASRPAFGTGVPAAPASHLADFDDALDRLDCAGDLRRHLEAARQLDLDLAAPGIELQDQRDLALAALAEPLGDRFERQAIAQEDADAALRLGGGVGEPLDREDAGAHVVG